MCSATSARMAQTIESVAVTGCVVPSWTGPIETFFKLFPENEIRGDQTPTSISPNCCVMRRTSSGQFWQEASAVICRSMLPLERSRIALNLRP